MAGCVLGTLILDAGPPDFSIDWIKIGQFPLGQFIFLSETLLHRKMDRMWGSRAELKNSASIEFRVCIDFLLVHRHRHNFWFEK